MKSIKLTLRELEAERARIDAAIMSLKSLYLGLSDGTKTIASVAIEHLRRVGEPQTSQQLREAIKREGIVATAGTIQTLLSRRALLKKDLIRKRRGVWALK